MFDIRLTDGYMFFPNGRRLDLAQHSFTDMRMSDIGDRALAIRPDISGNMCDTRVQIYIPHIWKFMFFLFQGRIGLLAGEIAGDWGGGSMLQPSSSFLQYFLIYPCYFPQLVLNSTYVHKSEILRRSNLPYADDDIVALANSAFFWHLLCA